MTPERRAVLTCKADVSVVHKLADTSDVFVMALLDSSPDCIKLIERDGTLSYMNPNGQCAMEIDDFTMVAGAAWSALWPEESQQRIAASVDAALRGETSRIEAFCPTAKGSARWWDVSVSPVLDGAGEVVRVLSVSRDITPIIEREDRLKAYDLQLKALNADLSAQLARADTLMREVDHRVKNSLAMVSSMLRIQARQVGDAASEAALRAASARVTTVARVHERLQKGRDLVHVDLSAYLPTIAEDLSDALAGEGVALCCDVPELSVDSDMAVALGLVASEMLTNAFKHAFAEREADCEVHLTVEQGDGRIRMSVRDNGRGGCETLDPSDPKGGLGTRIIGMYVQQLAATLTCDSPAGRGTTLTLDAPL